MPPPFPPQHPGQQPGQPYGQPQPPYPQQPPYQPPPYQQIPPPGFAPQQQPPPFLPPPGADFRRRTTVVLTVVFALCVVAGLTLVVLAILGGDTSLLLGALLALIPVGPVVGAFLLVDRWEAEPPKLLLAAFAWGASVAALTALIINSTTDYLATGGDPHSSGAPVAELVSAPLVEEGVKAAFVLLIWLFLRSEFDGIVDGVVYAGITAAGFAFTENILYFGRAFDEANASGAGSEVVVSFVMRGIFSPFAHPLFTVMTGIGIGIAASRRGGWRWIAPILGYLLAAILHAVWNGSATLFGLTGFIGSYVLIMVPVGVGVILIIRWQRRRERWVIATQLPWMSQFGWITPNEIPLLSDLRLRRRWRNDVAMRYGKPAGRAVREYQKAVTELAFLIRARERGDPPWQVDQRQRELLGQLGHAASTVRAIAAGGWRSR